MGLEWVSGRGLVHGSSGLLSRPERLEPRWQPRGPPSPLCHFFQNGTQKSWDFMKTHDR